MIYFRDWIFEINPDLGIVLLVFLGVLIYSLITIKSVGLKKFLKSFI